MIPELFRIGPIAISPFGVMLVMAFLTSYFQLRRGLVYLDAGTEEDASSMVVTAGLGGILGAKLYYAALYGDWRLIFDRSGLVWYGGFLLAAAMVIWVVRRRRLAPWKVLDAAAPALALGYGVGRVGCFLVGDDYGVPTELPWGVVFERGLPPTTAGYLRRDFGVDIPPEVADSALLAVHPTQLYETAAGLLIGWFGWRLLKRRPAVGSVALTMFALLAVERFLVEILRAKDDRLLGVFTVAQLISVAILVVLAFLWWRRRRSWESSA